MIFNVTIIIIIYCDYLAHHVNNKYFFITKGSFNKTKTVTKFFILFIHKLQNHDNTRLISLYIITCLKKT